MDKHIQIRMIYMDRLVSIILVLLCVYVYFAVQDFSKYSAVFPKYINTVFSFFVGIYFLKSWFMPFDKEKIEDTMSTLVDNKFSFFVIFPSTIVYIFIFIPYTGFLVSSFFYTLLVICTIKISRNEFNLKVFFNYMLFSLIFNITVYYIFRNLLNVRLPAGVFI